MLGCLKRAIVTCVPHYRVELHSHCQGDPIDTYLSHTLIEQIDQAKKVGIDALAITWHRKICSDEEAFVHAKALGMLLIFGMEAEIKGKHLVVLNLTEGDLPSQPTWQELRALRARKPGVLVFAPHPFYPHPVCLGDVINEEPDLIDAVEWCTLHVDWLPSGVNPNLRAERWAQQHGKTLIATSDAHSLTAIGKNPSILEADALTPEALFVGIRAGRVSFHRRSLTLLPLLRHLGQAMASQPRHVWRRISNKPRSASRPD